MKTIRLSDDTYDTLMDILMDVLFDHVMPGDSESARTLYTTIKVNTGWHDSEDEEDMSDVEKKVIERHVRDLVESLEERQREALLYFIDPVGWSKGSQNYALDCLLDALLVDETGLGTIDDSQENERWEHVERRNTYE